jgi:hypothetical protein
VTSSRVNIALRCDPGEVAIYVPPQAVTPLPAADALERCLAFLGDLVAGPPPDVQVFDDRAAKVTVTQGAFFDDIAGAMPALDALASMVATGTLRVVLTAEEGKLRSLSSNDGWLDDVQVIEAARVLSQRPDGALLAALHAAEASAWARVLQPLAGRRMKAPGGRRSNVGAPAPLVTAFLDVETFEGWCRIASTIADEALPRLGVHLRNQAVRHFEEWLDDGVAALPERPKAKRRKTPESAYWAHLAEARRALEDGRWDDVTRAAAAAERVAAKLPPEVVGAGTAVLRLQAGGQMGRLQFVEAWELLQRALLMESLFGVPWSPSERVAFAVGLSKRESELRYVAWLCTRISSLNDEEWRLALARLARQLDPTEAEALRTARAKPKPKKPKARKR